MTGCYIYGKRFPKRLAKYKSYQKVRGHCHFPGKCRGTAHSIYNLRFNVPNEIFVVFHNGSNCEYHFIIKELGNEFERKFENLGENTVKHKVFNK